MADCDECDEPSTHTIHYKSGNRRYLCCRHYLAVGNDARPCRANVAHEPRPATVLTTIAEEMRQRASREATADLAEYGESDYRGVAQLLTEYADRIRAVAQQLKG